MTNSPNAGLLLAVMFLCLACGRTCKDHVIEFVGALPGDTKIRECHYHRSDDDARFFELDAEMMTSLPFESIKTHTRTRSENLSGSERFWLSDLGEYKQTPFEGEFEPRGSIRVDPKYIVVLKDLGGGRIRVRVHGAPGSP